MKYKRRYKKSGKKDMTLEKIILITATIQMITAIIEFIKILQ